MSTIESLQWRYATKKFDDSKSLTGNQINTLKEAFNLTAISYGLQPIKLVIVNDKKIQEQLVEHSWNQQQVVQASHVLVICIQDQLDENDIEKYFSLVKEIRNTPDEILTPFKNYLKEDVSKKTTKELVPWMKNQAYIALGNLMTVAAIEKIDSCPMEGFVPSKYDELLHLEDKGLKSVLLLPIGYRADDDMFADFKKVRKPLKEAVIEL